MSQLRPEPALDTYPCRYGTSRTVFRGPKASLAGPYAVVVGGSETFGRYVEEPFCETAADIAGLPVVNLGVHCGGLDVFARDPALAQVIAGAAVVVVQVMSAANVSNRFYSVHPRRNDRFLKHSPILETLFPDVDFCDFAFTRHLLTGLQRASPEKFSIVARELEEAWTARMRLLLSRVPGEAILLRIEGGAHGPLGAEPLFVTQAALGKLSGLVDAVLRCDVTEACAAPDLDRMIFPETERALAEAALPPGAHDRIGTMLGQALAKSARAA